MAVLTARQLKDRESPEFSIDLGGGQEVIARLPDVQLMVLKGLLPTPLLGEMVKLVGQWAGTELLKDLTEDVIKESTKILAFVDAYVCAALVKPRVVATAADMDGKDDALLIDDLTIATRRLIVVKCAERASAERPAAPEVVAAAKEFPENGSGAGSGPDVSPVPDPTFISV